ncbi:hypothetical protein [Brevundimonas aveniformis]|uniref:hypothetical protein n=1 Tax=Brevundimonas aveniformis TaxID=370977 RepID=UPI0012EB1680|nr:hypothetical protein [Brevundimonas aveniformis]
MHRDAKPTTDQIAVRGYIHDMLQELVELAESRRLDDVVLGLRGALGVYAADIDDPAS